MPEEQQYTAEYLQYVEQANKTVLGKKILVAQATHQAKMQELTLKGQELTLKSLEISLQAQREALRPHRTCHTYTVYDPTEGKYRCQTFLDEDDFEDEVPIVAYGDTPAQACDNFDHIWIHGRS